MEEWEALNVDQRIISALERLKFDHPTEIQQRAIPPAVGGRLKSIVGAAETGSGKTLAYGIPIVQRMLNLQQNNNTIKYSRKRRRLNDLESEESDSSENESNSNSDINDDDDSEILDPDMISKFPGLFDIEELDPISMKPIKQKKKKILQTEEENSPLRALILTPTRELALQVKDHISHIINPKNNKEQHQIGIVALVGGMAEAKQLRLLQQRPEIVVGTPGRVWEAMDMGTSQNKIEPDSQIPSFKNKIVDKQQPWHPYDHISNLSGLCCFAVDEADRMVQQGMTKHLGLIVGKIKEEILRRKTEDQQNNGSRKGKIINSQESNKSDYLHLQTFLFSATLTLPKELRVRNSIKKRQKRSEAKEKQREKKFERRRQQEEKELQIQKKKVEKQKEMKNKQKQRKKEKKQKNQGKVNINIDEDDDEMIDFVKKKKRKRSEDDSDNDSTDISNVNIDSEKDSEESRSDVDSERDIKLKNIKQNTNESSVGSESDDDDESESEISDGEISIFNGVKLPLGLDPKILAFFPFTDAPVIVNLSNIQTNQFSSSKSSSSISNQQLEKVVPTVSATPSTLVHRYVTCAVGDKDTHLVYFLSRFRGRALIFVNTIDLIRFLVPMLRSLNIPTYGLHSQMQQRQRLKNLDRFKGYKLSNSNTGIALVVTDVVARGIDIENVTHVVHYQIPQSVDLYIHRSGRTARAGNEGFSLMIVCPSELKMLTSIRDALDQSVNTNNSSIVKKRKESVVKNFPEDLSFFPEIRERVTLAKKIVISERNIESLKDRKISFKDGDENSGQKSIERNDTYDDNEDSDSIGEQMQKEDEQMIKNKRQVKIQEQSQMLRKQLDAISQKPLIPKGVSVRYPTSNPVFMQQILHDRGIINKTFTNEKPTQDEERIHLRRKETKIQMKDIKKTINPEHLTQQTGKKQNLKIRKKEFKHQHRYKSIK